MTEWRLSNSPRKNLQDLNIKFFLTTKMGVLIIKMIDHENGTGFDHENC